MANRSSRSTSDQIADYCYLGPGSAAAWAPWTDAFVQRLRELGWIEARTIAIEYRWADGRFERFKEIAVEFVQRNVDVIVTG